MSEARCRLLQLVHGYPPAVGGVELSTRDLCEGLVANHSFEVTVLTTNAYTITNFHDASLPTIPIQPDEVQNGVRVYRFPVRTRGVWLLRQAQRVAYRLRLPGNGVLRTAYDGPISPGLLAAARTFEADVVCAASFPLNHMRYPFLRPHPRPPVVLVGAVHTNDDWGFNRPNLLALGNRAFATIAHTEHERDWLVRHGVQPERIRVIAHGVDSARLTGHGESFRVTHKIQPQDFVVAYLGQQAAHKGIDVLLAAFPSLLERRADARLVIAGSRTPWSTELERLVTRLPATARRRVLVVSDLPEQEKLDLLAGSDVFASPSRTESFGLTTLEAWALGKAVVVGDAPSQRSIVDHGRTGLIVPHGDVSALVEALASLTDPGKRTALGTAGRQLVRRRYDRHMIEAEYAALFREAARSGWPSG